MASPAIVLSARDRWLADAHLSVGASELAALLGFDPRRGQLSIYEAKLRKKPDDAERSWLAFGRRVEGAILDGYADKVGRPVRHNAAADLERFYHPDQPLLSATPDGFEDEPADDPAVVEAKAVSYVAKDQWHEDPPVHYLIQGQAQMACTGRKRGVLVALMWGITISDPITQTPDVELMKLALDVVEKFWWHVRNQKPPEADNKPETKDAIRRLWPTDNGQAIALDQQALDDACAFDVAKLRVKQYEDEAELLENKLRVRMGDAVIGYLPDRSSLLLKGSTVAPQLCKCGQQIKKGFTRRPLKRWLPQDLKKALKAASKEK